MNEIYYPSMLVIYRRHAKRGQFIVQYRDRAHPVTLIVFFQVTVLKRVKLGNKSLIRCFGGLVIIQQNS